MDKRIREPILKFLQQGGYGSEGVTFQPLFGDGSARAFWRIAVPKLESSLIAMVNPPVDRASRRENRAYLMIGRHLRQKGLPFPAIYGYNLDEGWFIMEDLGDRNLQDLLVSGEDPLPTYEKVLCQLLRLQIEGANDFDTAWCCQTARYDQNVMLRYEAEYFKNAFLCHYLGLKKEWPELEPVFHYLAETASRADSGFFLHRDFQSRNIMTPGGAIGIIDWQGGRLGPIGYDLASLIIDPYAALSLKQRAALYERYRYLIQGHDPAWVESFKRYYPYLAIQRNLQIIAAFSFLSKVMNKGYFEAYIPGALGSLHELLGQVPDRGLSPLRELISDIRQEKPSTCRGGEKGVHSGYDR